MILSDTPLFHALSIFKSPAVYCYVLGCVGDIMLFVRFKCPRREVVWIDDICPLGDGFFWGGLGGGWFKRIYIYMYTLVYPMRMRNYPRREGGSFSVDVCLENADGDGGET